jgi:hypothetical protein
VQNLRVCEIGDRSDGRLTPTWRLELQARGHAVGEAFLDDQGRLIVIIDDEPRCSRGIRHLLRRSHQPRAATQHPDSELVASS